MYLQAGHIICGVCGTICQSEDVEGWPHRHLATGTFLCGPCHQFVQVRLELCSPGAGAGVEV